MPSQFLKSQKTKNSIKSFWKIIKISTKKRQTSNHLIHLTKQSKNLIDSTKEKIFYLTVDPTVVPIN